MAEAIFSVKVLMDTTQVDAAVARGLARIDEISARARAGLITGPAGQEEVRGLAAQAQAQANVLRRSGVAETDRRLTELNQFVRLSETAFGELSASGKLTATALQTYQRSVLQAAARLEREAAVDQKRIAAPQKRTDANQALLNDPVTRFAEAESKRRLKDALASDDLAARGRNQQAIVANEATKARLTAEENLLTRRMLEADGEYAGVLAQATAAQRRLTAAREAAVQRELAGLTPGSEFSSARFINNLAEANVARRQISQRRDLLFESRLADDPLDSFRQGSLEALRRRRSVAEATAAESVLAADQGFIRATAELAALRRRRVIAERQAYLQATKDNIEAEARLAGAEQFRRASVGAEDVRLRRDDPLFAAQAEQTLSRQAVAKAQDIQDQAAKRAAIQRELAFGESTLVANLAEVKAAEEQRKLAVQRQVREKLGQAFLETQAREDVAQSAAAEQRRLQVANLTLANEENILAIKAQGLVTSKIVQEREREVAQALLQRAIAEGSVARGSFVQRLQASTAARQGGALRLPTDFATGPQLLRGSLVTTARFAASAALLYGGFAGLAKSIREAEELERILNQVRRQFESLGQADQFDGFRDSILRIARDTGSAANEVAFVGFQLQGAFGGDTQRALRETESAFKAVRVTGLQINEVIDAFTALVENFDNAGVTVESVTNKALGLQERFGVLAKETISFAADLAPVAAQAGFTVEQLEALGAVGQKYSGRSGSSLAEAFGRILPSIQDNAVQFLQLFQQLGDANLTEQVASAFREGNISGFFQILLAQYDNLTAAQKNYTIELLGGRREAQALIPILENSAELIQEFNRPPDEGTLESYYGDLQKTLNQQLKEFGETLSQLGVKIFESGLKDFLEDLIGLAGTAVDILGALIGVFTALGGAIGNIPGLGGGVTALLEGLLIYKGLGALSGFTRNRFGGGPGAGGGALGLLPIAATSGLPGPNGQPIASSVAAGGGSLAYRTGARFGAAQAAFRAAGAAEAVGFRATATAAASGFGGAMSVAFSGTNFALLGATIGFLVMTEISNGIRQSVENQRASIIGSDQRISDAEADILLGQSGLNLEQYNQRRAELLAERNQTYSRGRSQLPSVGELIDGLNLPGDNDSNRVDTINELKERLDGIARGNASAFQQFLAGNETFGITFSKDVTQNREFMESVVAELEQNRPIEFIDSILNNQEVLAEVATRVAGPDADAATAIGEFRGRLETLRAAIQTGAADPRDVDRFIEQYAGAQGEVADAERAIAARVREQEEALVEEGLRVLEADEALSLFESGEISAPAARAALREAISSRVSLGFDRGNAEQRKELADLIRREREFQGEILLREARFIADAYERFGGGNPEGSLQIYLNLLRGGNLTPDQQSEATEGAIDALQAVFDATLATAQTAEEQARLFATGIPVSEELQTQLIYQYLQQGSIAYQEFIFVAANGLQDYANAITQTAAQIYAQGNVTITEAIRQSILTQIAALEAEKQLAIEGLARAVAVAGIKVEDGIAGVAADYDERIAALMEALGQVPEIQVPDFSNFGQDSGRSNELNQQAADERRRKALDIRLAQIDVQRSLIEGDRVAEADLDLQIAQAEEQFAREEGDEAGRLRAIAAQNRARRAREEAVSAIGVAERDLALAQRGDDPIGTAYVDLLNANEALRLARGAEAQLLAQAQQVRAQRALAEAFQDIGIAQLELVQAFADAAGDSVESARIALQIAEQQLADVRANTPNDQAAILRAQANVVSQEAALRDAQLNERQRQIDVALQLEQITTQQAIAQLQALLQIPNLTQEQIDNLLLRIKQLQDELKGDFRFNLPTQLYLPTAYEARRLGQTETGSGYNDNRQINVTVNAETNADPDAIAAAVVTAVGQPNRTGTQPRRY